MTRVHRPAGLTVFDEVNGEPLNPQRRARHPRDHGVGSRAGCATPPPSAEPRLDFGRGSVCVSSPPVLHLRARAAQYVTESGKGRVTQPSLAQTFALEPIVEGILHGPGRGFGSRLQPRCQNRPLRARRGPLVSGALLHRTHGAARFMDSTQITLVVAAQDRVALLVRAAADHCLIESSSRFRTRLRRITISAHWRIQPVAADKRGRRRATDPLTGG